MRELIKLVSEEGTGYFYTTDVNRKAQGNEKLRFRKYDAIAKKHAWFKQEKIK